MKTLKELFETDPNAYWYLKDHTQEVGELDLQSIIQCGINYKTMLHNLDLYTCYYSLCNHCGYTIRKGCCCENCGSDEPTSQINKTILYKGIEYQCLNVVYDHISEKSIYMILYNDIKMWVNEDE